MRQDCTTATLFLTGMQRSGTTLLDKLLAGHPRLSVLSQPFPLLFVEAKRSFLRTLGERDASYPLGDLFLETRYRPRDLAAHLAAQRLDGTALAPLFAVMESFSGQYTRFAPARTAEVLAGLEPGDLAAVAAQIYRALAHRPGAILTGGKETTCEELLPYLLDRGYRCLLVLRDPRDVLASLAHGEGRRHGGRLKPTLFNLRQWRKSVAFALHLEDHPGCLWLRYEDLAARPAET
ncbi:MAG TPA: sulfotransferase, partial [Thermoanaerobaculia bacterium]|nr:sulfotransferase [Thermoanaerobaculia bacterium]